MDSAGQHFADGKSERSKVALLHNSYVNNTPGNYDYNSILLFAETKSLILEL